MNEIGMQDMNEMDRGSGTGADEMDELRCRHAEQPCREIASLDADPLDSFHPVQEADTQSTSSATTTKSRAPVIRRAAFAALLSATLATSSRPALAQSPSTTRIDLGPGGVQTNLASWEPTITGDGRYIAYFSYANNLVPGDTGFKADVFVYDSHTATTVMASVDSNGVQGNGDSAEPGISNDGRLVVFNSLASNLVPGDANGAGDIFVRDRVAGTTTRISVDSSGAEANGPSLLPRISGDGRFVVFESNASNLVPGDTNGQRDIFVRDLGAGTTTRVSVDSSGVQGNGFSQHSSISSDGRFVAFESTSSNLVANDTNAASDVFVHDNLTGVTTRVSVDSSGVQGNGDSVLAAISPSGHLVGFSSLATNLIPGDTNVNVYDLFVRDLNTGSTKLVSTDSNGAQVNDGSFDPAISADDRFVAFDSGATNLVPGDTNGWPDVFVKDLLTQKTTRVSVSTDGAQSVSQSGPPSISGDGRLIVFYSYSNLVPSDTNGVTDIYLRDTGSAAFSSSCNPGENGVIACPCANAPNLPGFGCNNSSATGGAAIDAFGVASLANDTVVFATSGEKPTATSIVLQGTSQSASGLSFGQGVRCIAGSLKRLYTKTASGGSITAPNLGGGDSPVSVRSASLGDTIAPGSSRWYLVYYRDPVVLGGCPSVDTFNATQTGRIDWSM